MYLQTKQKSYILGMIWRISLNIRGCCWLPPLTQNLCPGEGVRWAGASTEAQMRGGPTPGSESVLLQLLQKVSVYLAWNCWQSQGCCRRCPMRSSAVVSSVPKPSGFLGVAGGVCLWEVLPQPRPLPGLQTRAGSLFCALAPQSLVLTDHKCSPTEREGDLGKLWISFHSRIPQGSHLGTKQTKVGVT